MLKKGKLYLLITFITARIEYAIAFTGLNLLPRRNNPAPIVESVRIDRRLQHGGRWIIDCEESNYLYFSPREQQAVILRLTGHSKN